MGLISLFVDAPQIPSSFWHRFPPYIVILWKQLISPLNTNFVLFYVFKWSFINDVYEHLFKYIFAGQYKTTRRTWLTVTRATYLNRPCTRYATFNIFVLRNQYRLDSIESLLQCRCSHQTLTSQRELLGKPWQIFQHRCATLFFSNKRIIAEDNFQKNWWTNFTNS